MHTPAMDTQAHTHVDAQGHAKVRALVRKWTTSRIVEVSMFESAQAYIHTRRWRCSGLRAVHYLESAMACAYLVVQWLGKWLDGQWLGLFLQRADDIRCACQQGPKGTRVDINTSARLHVCQHNRQLAKLFCVARKLVRWPVMQGRHVDEVHAWQPTQRVHEDDTHISMSACKWYAMQGCRRSRLMHDGIVHACGCTCQGLRDDDGGLLGLLRLLWLCLLWGWRGLHDLCGRWRGLHDGAWGRVDWAWWWIDWAWWWVDCWWWRREGGRDDRWARSRRRAGWVRRRWGWWRWGWWWRARWVRRGRWWWRWGWWWRVRWVR